MPMPLRAAAAATVIAAASLAGYAQEAKRLTASEIRALFRGSEMTATNAAGLRFTEQYKADGTFSAWTNRRDGSCCASDKGRWTVEGNQLCKQYERWQRGELRCSYILKAGETYTTGSGIRLEFSKK